MIYTTYENSSKYRTNLEVERPLRLLNFVKILQK